MVAKDFDGDMEWAMDMCINQAVRIMLTPLNRYGIFFRWHYLDHGNGD